MKLTNLPSTHGPSKLHQNPTFNAGRAKRRSAKKFWLQFGFFACGFNHSKPPKQIIQPLRPLVWALPLNQKPSTGILSCIELPLAVFQSPKYSRSQAMSTKRKVATIAAPVVRASAKARSKAKIDETRAAVSTGLSKQPDEPIELPSDDEDVKDQQQIEQVAEETTQGDVDMDMGMGGDVDDAEPAAPAAFGDIVRGNSTVDVVASLAADTAGPSSRSDLHQRQAGLINAASLGTVINQALRTNDAQLLELCLQTSDLKIVENTINRMDSALALELLSRLASRMHRRPGRAMNLMSWMKFTMIAHGGALVTQPDLTARLAELSRVLEERARGLPALLALRGKLEMLDAQLKFRKSAKLAGGNRDRLEGKDELSESEDEDQDEAQVVYVEGQESTKALTNGGPRAGPADDEDDFPINHSALPDSDEDDDEEEDEDEDEEDLAAIESLDEDEVDHDDVDEEEEDDSEGEDAGPPAKVQRTLRSRK